MNDATLESQVVKNRLAVAQVVFGWLFRKDERNEFPPQAGISTTTGRPISADEGIALSGDRIRCHREGHDGDRNPRRLGALCPVRWRWRSSRVSHYAKRLVHFIGNNRSFRNIDSFISPFPQLAGR
jgi:hypothetical protein